MTGEVLRLHHPRLAATALAGLIAWTLLANLSAKNPDPDLVSVFAEVVPQVPAGSLAFKSGASDGAAGRAGRYAHHSLLLAAAPRPIEFVEQGPPDTEWAIGYQVGAIQGYQTVERFGHGIRLYRRRP